MNSNLRAFIRAYLSRCAMGASMGLTTVASASPATISPAETVAPSFAERLSRVRSAVSECVEDPGSASDPLPLQGVVPRPPPLPPKEPPKPQPFSKFANFDNSPPWNNFDQKTPFTNFGKAPLKDPK